MDRGTLEDARARWNGARFVLGSERGHYESWFQRANHPSRPLAFWIRYTIFSPRGRGADAIGELWAIFFDGEAKRVYAVKEEVPISACRFSGRGLDATVGAARLDAQHLEGSARRGERSIAWSLRYGSDAPPLLLLPENLYEGGFPKAKALVGAPGARFDGHLVVGGERVEVEGWVGSQNHNWGSEHTARYAWGQVAGFDDAPDAFLEVTTARVRLATMMGAPVLTPSMTVLVLRLDGEELRFSAIPRALRARGQYAPFTLVVRDGRPAHAHRGQHRGAIVVLRGAAVLRPARRHEDVPQLEARALRPACGARRAAGAHALDELARAAFEILSNEPAPSGVQRLDG